MLILSKFVSCFLLVQQHPRSKLTYTPFPATRLVRSSAHTKTLPHGRRSGPSKGAKSRDIVSIIVTLVVGGVIGWLASIVMRTDAQQGIVLNVGAHDDA